MGFYSCTSTVLAAIVPESFWKWWLWSLSWFLWWLHRSVHLSKLAKWYFFDMYSLLDANGTSMILLLKDRWVITSLWLLHIKLVCRFPCQSLVWIYALLLIWEGLWDGMTETYANVEYFLRSCQIASQSASPILPTHGVQLFLVFTNPCWGQSLNFILIVEGGIPLWFW